MAVTLDELATMVIIVCAIVFTLSCILSAFVFWAILRSNRDG